MKLAELHWPEVKKLDRETLVALVPVGSMEQHGPHLPFQVDVLVASRLAEDLEKKIPEILLAPHRAVKRPRRQPLELGSAGTGTLRRAGSHGEHSSLLGLGAGSGQVAQENQIERHGSFGGTGNIADALPCARAGSSPRDPAGNSRHRGARSDERHQTLREYAGAFGGRRHRHAVRGQSGDRQRTLPRYAQRAGESGARSLEYLTFHFLKNL